MYTSQQPCDVEVIEATLAAVVKGDFIRFLEIGVFGGDTARGVKHWCDTHGVKLDYWGIDNCAKIETQAPFDGATFIKGDAAEVFHLIPYGFDVVFSDQCHCFNHVILDVIHYGPRVRLGGYMMFHDTSPEIQQTIKDPHGPCIPEFHNSVLAALKAIRFPTADWKLRMETYAPGAPFGGIQSYEKVL